MQKAMISQPMAGRIDEEIVQARERATAFLKGMSYEEGATARDRNGQIGGHKA